MLIVSKISQNENYVTGPKVNTYYQEQQDLFFEL